MRTVKRVSRTGAVLMAAAWAVLLGIAAPAFAGQLILSNSSANVITCSVDGWTVASGASFDWVIQVQPNVPFHVGPNTARQGPTIINWATCGNLTTRAMTITPTGPNQTLQLTGQQTRVLNVSLYPYLPTLPTDDFENLVNHVVATYQQQQPQVLLNAVLNQQVDIYSFTSLPGLLGASGFDVMELDMLYLGFLADGGLINPATITGPGPLRVAAAGASYKGTLWGVPSWLCMDFFYAGDPAAAGQTTLSQLLAYLAKMPSGKPAMVGDFNGSWRLPSLYINAYVQGHGGYGSIGQSTQMPPDPATIANIVALTNNCASGGVNNCTNGTYHNSPNGTTEQVFATGGASTDVGFSEQSFFINLYGPVANLTAVAMPWGQSAQPLLFEDAFVTSKATCRSAPCSTDALAFTTLMTNLPMKNYITQSQDLPANAPWRTLLTATAAFWQQPAVMQNPMYAQYANVFATAQPFPNTFTASLQTAMATQVCAALQQKQPAYVCKTSAGLDAPAGSTPAITTRAAPAMPAPPPGTRPLPPTTNSRRGR